VLATARIGAPRPRIVNYRVAPHVYTLENIGGSSFVATSTRKSRFLLLLLLRTRGTQKNERNGESACDFFMYSCVLVGGCCCVLCVPFAVPSVDVGYTTKKRDFFFFFHDFRRSASNMACLSSCVGCWILHILCPNSQLRPTPIWVACESCEVAIFFDFFFFFSRVHARPARRHSGGWMHRFLCARCFCRSLRQANAKTSNLFIFRLRLLCFPSLLGASFFFFFFFFFFPHSFLPNFDVQVQGRIQCSQRS
jgi:hypothetical protein